jgi:hypothetical protein
MSDIAVTWAKAQTCPDRSSKQVLVDLAGYADASGEAWAMVSVLAFESQATDRTVQRALRALEDAGLIKRTGRNKTFKGKVMPIYKLPLDTGPANTRDAMRLLGAWGDTGDTPRKRERASGAVRDDRSGGAPSRASGVIGGGSEGTGEAVAKAARGDMGDAPPEGLGVTRVTPQGTTDVTPWGDTDVTQIGKLDSQGLKPSARACARAARLWSGKAPERVSPVRVEAAWAAALDRTTDLTPERLEAAVAQAVKRDPDFGRGKAMNLDRWLDEGRFLPWLADEADEPGLPARSAWAGPENLRTAVASAMGESGAVAYLDPARWDGERSVIVARTSLARDRLRAGVKSAFGRLGVTVECEVRGGA